LEAGSTEPGRTGIEPAIPSPVVALMPPRARPLTETDRAAWDAFASQIAPLKGRQRPLAPATPAAPRIDTRPSFALPAKAAAAMPRPVSVGDHPGGVDKATWQRFRSGKLPATRKLDLHGQTAQRAHHALIGFLRSAYADRVRCVEIVTGRGSGENGGVIRRELPLWLNLPDIRPLILAAAHPHAANPGSVRVLLRRVR
jgi:DNA-nicking Smr family endonuclease